MKDGCYMGDFCYPKDNGLSGKNGNDCPVSCPAKCDDSMNDLRCPGGEDDNGCPMPDSCRSMYEDCPAIPSTECPGPGTTTPGPVCEDKWKTKKCKKQKDAGKCNKKAVRKNCQKTCEKC